MKSAHAKHFAAIAEAQAAVARDVDVAAARLSIGERLKIGFSMVAIGPIEGARLAQVDADADGQMELARRRIALGLTRNKHVPDTD